MNADCYKESPTYKIKSRKLLLILAASVDKDGLFDWDELKVF